jgi:two-component system sensor histidine kinase QseC
VRSIRAALQARLLAALILVLVVAGGALYLLIHARLLAQFDAALLGKARLLAAGVKYEGETLEADFVEQPPPELARTRDPEYLELWGEGEVSLADLLSPAAPGPRVLARSPSLDGRDLPYPAAADPLTVNLRLPDGRAGRAVALRFVPGVDGDRPGPPARVPVVLLLGGGRASLDGALRTVQLALVAVGLLVLLAVALVVTRVVPAALRPLEQVAEQALRIDAPTLDLRFPTAGLPRELAAICARLNELLDRLEVSFARERRFTSDVAHELRTPIAELRTAAQVALLWPDGDPVLVQPLEEALEIAQQMDQVVSNLLALARSQAGRDEVALDVIDLATATRDAWRPFAAEAAAKALLVMMDTQLTAVATDPALLARMLGNLFSNAVQYTPSGGDLLCSFARGDAVTLTLTNQTDGLTGDDLPHLWEPFWRKDPARSDRAHAGLGLPLVAAIAERLAIDVRAALAGDRFSITLQFPPARWVL